MKRRQLTRNRLIALGVVLLTLVFVLPSNGVPVPDAAHPYAGFHARGGPPIYITVVQGVGALACLFGSITALVFAARLK